MAKRTRYVDTMTTEEFRLWRAKFLELNLPQLATLLGVEESTAWRWEQGERNVGQATLLRARFRELILMRAGLMEEYAPQEEPAFGATPLHLDLRLLADSRRPLRRSALPTRPSEPSD